MNDLIFVFHGSTSEYVQYVVTCLRGRGGGGGGGGGGRSGEGVGVGVGAGRGKRWKVVLFSLYTKDVSSQSPSSS